MNKNLEDEKSYERILLMATAWHAAVEQRGGKRLQQTAEKIQKLKK